MINVFGHRFHCGMSRLGNEEGGEVDLGSDENTSVDRAERKTNHDNPIFLSFPGSDELQDMIGNIAGNIMNGTRG